MAIAEAEGVMCDVIEKFADVVVKLSRFGGSYVVKEFERLLKDTFPDVEIYGLSNMFSKSDLIVGSVLRDQFNDYKINGAEIIFYSMDHGPTSMRIQLDIYKDEVEGFEIKHINLKLTWRNTEIFKYSVKCI